MVSHKRRSHLAQDSVDQTHHPDGTGPINQSTVIHHNSGIVGQRLAAGDAVYEQRVNRRRVGPEGTL